MNVSRNRKRRHKKKVLEEQQYLDTLSSIIRRDYFPDLVQNVDDKLHRDLSLDGFHSRYTSEDNQSFAQVLEDSNEKKRHAHNALHGGPALLTAPPDQRLLAAPSCRDPDVVVDKETRPQNTRFKVPLLPSTKRDSHELRGSSVEMTPLINPRPSHEMFTFGQIEGTPQVLRDDPKFYIPSTPSREQTASSLLLSSKSRAGARARQQASIRDSPFGGVLSTPRRKR